MNQIPRVIISLLFTVLLLNSSNLIGAGSYPFVEAYYLDLTENKLIEKITEFKATYPQYQPIRIQVDGSLKEVKDRSVNNRYLFYFYLPQHDWILRCVLVQNSKNMIGIGFYGVSHTDFTGSKRINTSDFTRKENKYYKKLFEEEVLTPFKEFIVNQ